MPYSDGDLGPRRLRVDNLTANVYLDELLDVTISEHYLGMTGAPSPAIIGTPVTSYHGTAAASQTVDLPVCPAIGNVLMLLLVYGWNTITDVPAGWGDDYIGAAIPYTAKLGVFLLRVTGKESWYADPAPQVTFTFNDTTRTAAIVAELDNTLDFSDGWTAGWNDADYDAGTSTAPNSPSVTAAVGDAFLWISLFFADVGTTVSSYPTGYTLGQASIASGTGAGHFTAGFCGKQSTSTSEDPGAFGLADSVGWSAWTTPIVGALSTIRDNEVIAWDAATSEWINQSPRYASILGMSTDNKAYFKTTDTDTYLKYASNSIRFVVGGTTVLTMSSTGCVITT
jgi:hypothetical protein